MFFFGTISSLSGSGIGCHYYPPVSCSAKQKTRNKIGKPADMERRQNPLKNQSQESSCAWTRMK